MKKRHENFKVIWMPIFVGPGKTHQHFLVSPNQGHPYSKTSRSSKMVPVIGCNHLLMFGKASIQEKCKNQITPDLTSFLFLDFLFFFFKKKFKSCQTIAWMPVPPHQEGKKENFTGWKPHELYTIFLFIFTHI